MANHRLIDHYEAKYAGAKHEASATTPLSRSPRNRYEAAVATVLPLLSGGAVLEIGGGDGRVGRGIAAAGGDFSRYVITDLAAVRANQIVASCSDSRFEGYPLDVEGDTSALDGQRFDTILLIALIEHLIDPIGAMKYLRGLLLPGGFVYIDTPNIAKYTRRLKLAAGRFPSTASLDEGLRTYEGEPIDLYDEGHLHYWTYGSLEKMLTRYCGFRRVVRAPYGGALSSLLPTLFSDVVILAYV